MSWYMIKTGVGAIEVRRESEKIAAEAIGYRVWPFEVESTPIKSDDDSDSDVVSYNTMTKVELLAYALDKFDADLRDRDTKSSLIEQIIALGNK